MNYYDKLKHCENISGANYWSRRISAELQYLAKLSEVNDNIYNTQIETALDFLIERFNESAAITKADALKAEEMLSSLGEAAKAIKVICISHAHIDMNWMWGFQETVSVTVDTFRTMLNLMKEYPEFTYGQSQASVYKIIEKYAPEMIGEIKKYVHEGRWELTASQWVETDKNMPNGESLSRHILYTKRYLADLFDIDPDTLKLDYEPDTFGHNLNVPEILQNGGVDYYYHCRGYDGHNIYRWRSPSGKEILAYREPNWYNSDINQFSFKDIPLFCKKYNLNKFLKVFGVGDHGGGPTRRDIEEILDMNNYPLYPIVKFGTYAEFYSELELHREEFPIVTHELNFVFTGCYTSQSKIKLANRVGEARLQEAEFLSAAAVDLAGAAPQQCRYAQAWENVLFNHFHDILPGSGIRETRDYALALSQMTLGYANTGANLAMRALADNICTESIAFDEDNNTTSEGGGAGFTLSPVDGHSFPITERGRGKTRVIHMFNSTMYECSEPVEITLWDYNYDHGRIKITDIDGNEVAFQFSGNGSHYWGHTYLTLLIDAKIPAFGYNTYIIGLRPYDSGLVAVFPTDPRQDYIADTPIVLENEYIKAVFCPLTMSLTSFTDKESGNDLIDKPACLFRFIKENPRHGMTSWRVGPYMHIDNLNGGDFTVRVQDYRHESLRKYARFEIRFASSVINVTVSLMNNKRMLEFDTTVDWREIGGDFLPQLNFYVPAAYKVDKYRYDIPFGTIDRAAIAHDVPANSYMQLVNDGGKSLFIVTDSKYGFRGIDNSGAVTLIRSSTEPDPYPEFGKHVIKIGVGIGGCCDIPEAVEKFVHPVSFASNNKHCGALELNGKLFTVDGDVTVSAVKSAEDCGTVLRVSNPKCCEAALASITFTKAVKCAVIVDITEKHIISECKVDGNKVSFDVPAYGMVTLLVK